jgi:dihydrofolate reductase
MRIALIAAIANNNVIGFKGKLPWHIPGDMKYFKETTIDHCCIMGKNTALSLNSPLESRINIVITNTPMEIPSGFLTASSIKKAIEIAETYNKGDIFIIGGESLYKQFLPTAELLYITEIYKDFEGDTFFPDIDSNIWKCINEKNVPFNIKDNNAIHHSFKIFIRR